MNPEDLILVSVDDHVVEPADVFKGRLPAKYVEAAPRLIRHDDGTNAWIYEGQEIVNVALNAVAGRPKEEYGWEPTSMEEIRPGCYDVHARVKDMDAGGTLGSMCFASFTGYIGKIFFRQWTRSRLPRSCGRTTTGTSTSGAGRTRAASFPWSCP